MAVIKLNNCVFLCCNWWVPCFLVNQKLKYPTMRASCIVLNNNFKYILLFCTTYKNFGNWIENAEAHCWVVVCMRYCLSNLYVNINNKHHLWHFKNKTWIITNNVCFVERSYAIKKIIRINFEQGWPITFVQPAKLFCLKQTVYTLPKNEVFSSIF